ncbi:MAG TPA: TetR/AcrR family transcriptional regulator [Rubrivivax sp.]|nr:TetR/AcrR family transcriptional regulator [Rubrivivax sp.]
MAAPKAFDATVVKSQVTDPALVQRRRDQIVAAAVELFSVQGFYRTTMQQIARKAGVSTGLIYQYAQTKEDVLLLSLMFVMERFRRQLESSRDDGTEPLSRLYAALDTYCRVVDRHRDATVLAYRSTLSLPRAYREYIKQAELETNELMAQRIRSCIEAGLFKDANVELLTYRLVLHAHAWALKYWRLSQFATIGEYVDEGFDFCVRALATPKGKAQYSRFVAARGTQETKARRQAAS